MENQAQGVASVSGLIRKIKDGTIKEVVEDWKWIFGYSVRYKGVIAAYTALGILTTTLSLVGSIAGKYVIDIITGYELDKLSLLIAVIAGSTLLNLLMESFVSRLLAKINISIHNDIQANIFDKIIDADWLSVNEFSNGDILNRFNTDISTVSSSAISWLPTIVIALYKFVSTFLVILHYDVTMAFISLAGAPLLLLCSGFFVKGQRYHGQKVRQVSSKIMSFEAETFYNFDTIKSFGIASFYGRKMRQHQEEQKEASLNSNLFSVKANIVTTLVSIIAEFASFGYCLFLLWSHLITYGTMTLFLQQGANLVTSFKNLVSIIPTFLNGSVSAHRIRELVSIPSESHIALSSEMDKFIPTGFTVKLENVCFSYKEDKRVLNSSNLLACPGEIIAVIGASGEGKTTLVRLILGLVKPKKGRVFICSQTGESVDVNVETRHLFAYVPQGNSMIAGTIAENLLMVKPNATEDELIRSLELSCALDFVKKLPDGLNTNIGEKGRGLSEGQAQRIAIARAILKDAPILLLDEATSALDVTTERKVLKNIITAQPNKTCIITTHRPSVLGMCKRIYRVMDFDVTELSEEDSAKAVMDF